MSGNSSSAAALPSHARCPVRDVQQLQKKARKERVDKAPQSLARLLPEEGNAGNGSGACDITIESPNGAPSPLLCDVDSIPRGLHFRSPLSLSRILLVRGLIIFIAIIRAPITLLLPSVFLSSFSCISPLNGNISSSLCVCVCVILSVFFAFNLSPLARFFRLSRRALQTSPSAAATPLAASS